jgi:23S rRNA U2552 (ribose-2'-O)-methylase RlmE/FtsJ
MSGEERIQQDADVFSVRPIDTAHEEFNGKIWEVQIPVTIRNSKEKSLTIRRELLKAHSEWAFSHNMQENSVLENTFGEKLCVSQILARIAQLPIHVDESWTNTGEVYLKFTSKQTDGDWTITTDDLILPCGIRLESASSVHKRYHLASSSGRGEVWLKIHMSNWSDAIGDQVRYRVASQVNWLPGGDAHHIRFALTGRMPLAAICRQIEDAVRSEITAPTMPLGLVKGDAADTAMSRQMVEVHSVRPEIEWHSIGGMTFEDSDLQLFTPDMTTSDDLVDKTLLQKMLVIQNNLDRMSTSDKRLGRIRSNPWDSLGKHIFINRAALKLAELDKLFGLLESGAMLAKSIESSKLRMGDFASGPGGFSEYTLWRAAPSTIASTYKRNRNNLHDILGSDVKHVDIVAVTLANKQDNFKTENFVVQPTGNFTPLYGEGGTGDITDPQVAETVRKHVGQDKLHFVACDGGFDVGGHEGQQESMSTALVCSELALALETLHENGTLICKVFLMTSPIMCRILYVLATSVDRICIVKPITSRPANSERYIVAEGYRNSGNASTLLRHAADAMVAGRPVLLPQIIPDVFVRWIRSSTNRHIILQTRALNKYVGPSQHSRNRSDQYSGSKEDAFGFWELYLQEKAGRKRKQVAK